MVRRRLDDDRRAELLDGVLRIITAKGFADVRVSDIAHELSCSVATLYKIAPSKDSLVRLAISRWAALNLGSLEACADEGTTAAEKARCYFKAGADRIRPLSLEFYRDIDRFESTRTAWRTTVVDPYIDRFVELVQRAADAGETRAVNVRFLGEVLRGIGFVTRDERVLRASGLTSEEAVLEVDRMIWDGILRP
jgi:AcrR family transcriptional regulator